ncbi:glycosyltransferase family 47 protein [Mixia osmundae IAM 14324]|uniref:Exostosin GT47 domain-containing protein n=1 Tax=Mixia osmundae (strain CBS 9802 / IAM 14324 / JCM 22182 / KY 12970) TaxID=764103 RepID=G7DYW0_MIXOS|nr:glycosyltransferase family 47 protein [Mixia osmundae IAM 14324]KEI41666.1 glycosyltransferase family 47 protein [Mixia osmundae IAM 14324]GAA95770.1 hypothetical protein E5Q_02427 [Mixia osmundae IAM 14324]
MTAEGRQLLADTSYDGDLSSLEKSWQRGVPEDAWRAALRPRVLRSFWRLCLLLCLVGATVYMVCFTSLASPPSSWQAMGQNTLDHITELAGSSSAFSWSTSTLSCRYPFKIYVYDLPQKHTTDLVESVMSLNYFCTWDCVHAQFTAEIQMHRYLLQSCARTDDIEEADLYYLPVYVTAETRRNSTDGFAQGHAIHAALSGQNMTALEQYYGINTSYVSRYPERHVYYSAHPRTGWHPLWSDDAIDTTRAIKMTNEVPAPMLVNRTEHNFVVMPYDVQNAPWRPEREWTLASKRRMTIFSIFGTHGLGATVRQQLARSSQTYRGPASVGLTDFANATVTYERFGLNLTRDDHPMFHSAFCAVPAGDTPTTRRLFNAIFAGCIPVIFSDELVLPFHRSQIPYEDMLLRYPMDQDEAGLHKIYDDLHRMQLDGTADKMQRALNHHRRKLEFELPFEMTPGVNYTSFRGPDRSQTGDAFDYGMRELAMRVADLSAS